MGIGGSSEVKNRAEAVVDRKEREKCWLKRDAYHQCLLAHEGRLTEEEAAERCRSLRPAYIAACPDTWVNHFDRKFALEQYNRQLESQGTTFKPSTSVGKLLEGAASKLSNFTSGTAGGPEKDAPSSR